MRARAAGMRIVGPNSQGLANFGTGAVASFSTMFLEVEPADGPVGIISQSGMMSVVPFGLLRRRGIGVRHAHATGNDADVSLAGAGAGRGRRTRPCGCCCSTSRASATRRCSPGRRPSRANVTCRSSRSRPAARFAVRRRRGRTPARWPTRIASSTRSSGSTASGARRTWTSWSAPPSCISKGWRPSGRRLAVVSNSGASCVMAADAAHEPGTGLERPGRTDGQRRWRHDLPYVRHDDQPRGHHGGAADQQRALRGRSCRVLADDPRHRRAARRAAGRRRRLRRRGVRGGGGRLHRGDRTGRSWCASPQASVAADFGAAGVPVFASQTDAIAALAQLAHHTTADAPCGAGPDASPDAVRAAAPAAHDFSTRRRAWRSCRRRGCRWSSIACAGRPTRRGCAFRDLGPRVVVKACAAEIPHKSDYGLVILDIDSEADVVLAFTDLEARLDALGVVAEGVIVARWPGVAASSCSARRSIRCSARW